MAVARALTDVLNPAQQQVVDLLGTKPEDELPAFDPALRDNLRTELEAGLEPVLGLLPEKASLYVSKHQLTMALGCEARLLAERDCSFEWTVPLARGTVAHKAIELSTQLSGETPMTLVDEAVASLMAKDTSLADWLNKSSAVDRAELQQEANDRVAKFLECFPPLRRQWTPVTESRLRVELFDARIVLIGRSDLTLGRSQGSAARKVIIDLKTGGFSPSHGDDLRFYALLETIRVGVPPRLTASYYLDSGRPFPERVTEGVLHAAVERTIGGTLRLAGLLHGGAVARKLPGTSCRWCAALGSCAEGQAFLDVDRPVDAFAGSGA